MQNELTFRFVNKSRYYHHKSLYTNLKKYFEHKLFTCEEIHIFLWKLKVRINGMDLYYSF